MPDQEAINCMALSYANYFTPAAAIALYRRAGSATELLAHRADIREVCPDAAPRLVEALRDMGDAMRRAEVECAWDEEHNVETLTPASDNYPDRLRECDDAPLVLHYMGAASPNALRVVSVVGTRKCTPYGQDLIRHFVEDLKTLCPKCLVVSGLAYGVDIHAHRRALDAGMDTVAVLAHGLDMIYPARHRPEAVRMVEQGGLLTEYPTQTKPDKMNFVRRNRIVAGMADAVVLVESAEKGGGLITVRIANDYHRDTFAFPGAVGAPYSVGCNQLIRRNGAALITSAADFVEAMGWQHDGDSAAARKKGIERQLFPELAPDEQRIVDCLKKHNDLNVNVLTAQSGVPMAQLTALLFSLELKGVLKPYAGGIYHLLG